MTLNKFKIQTYKVRQIVNKGWATKVKDWFHVLEGGATGLISDDFDDVAHAIPPYLKSLDQLGKLLAGAKEQQNAAANEAQSAISQTKPANDNKPATTQTAPIIPIVDPKMVSKPQNDYTKEDIEALFN